MKTKLTIIVCIFGLQVIWGQDAKKPDASLTRKETTALRKRDALQKKAAPLIVLYEAELDAINSHIKEVNKLLMDATQGAEATDLLLNTTTDLIKQRNELTAKIGRLKTNPRESDVTESTVKNKIDVKEARYTFLNGVNFDFNDSKTNYVGHFNVYVPSNDSGEKLNRWGINVGILKVNYMTRDSIANFSPDNVLINPLDNPDVAGESYNRQYNRYMTSTKVISTSFYAQPMYMIGDQGAANFYLHGHFELLWSKFETGTKVKTLQNEQVTINDENPAPPPATLIRTLETETHQTVNLSSPHLGAGATFDFNFKDNCILFLQPTIGLALNTIDRFPTQDSDGNYTLNTYKKSQGFFLLRTYFQYSTSAATQIIIGTDIRGLLPDQQPYLSAYVGLNLGIDEIFK